MRARRVAGFDEELDLGRFGRHGGRQGGPEILPDDVLDERQVEGAGLSSAMVMTVLATTGRSAVRATASTTAGEDQGEDEELQQADGPVTAAATTAVARTRDGLGEFGDGVGRIGVRVVLAGRLGAPVPGASAGADRHQLISWGSGVRRVDERRPARVSSSSWRMMAAASRSTRAR